MFQARIKDLNGVLFADNSFPTEQEAQAWIIEGNDGKWWGETTQEIIPAVTEIQQIIIQEAVLDEEGNVLEEAIVEDQEIVIEPEQVINHPATYTVEIVDISAELEQKQKLTTRAEKRAFGESMIDLISTINESANVNEATLEALILDQDFLVIREHLYSGSLKSAYNKILASETKILTVFSQPNLDLVKSQLLAKLQQLGEV
jgi:hypothetical protein